MEVNLTLKLTCIARITQNLGDELQKPFDGAPITEVNLFRWRGQGGAFSVCIKS
jgi:hypothetical protein